MDLRLFILRGQVLSLYRTALRTIRVAQPHIRDELKQQVRHEFVAHRSQADVIQIKYLLSEGRKKVKELDEMLCGVQTTLPR
ncbi:hypothetical protein HOP50_01g01260 [Chloropicon primus]|uniref:LYR motif-containing protein 2 n=1 Tax=Chloropicon primus TaxID=1764295 RepID=A0A5B8MBK3_9CHLO|nr:hypothetical protein A3770_01p01370 [Chloropicon primus]UPQ96835.1 hypothetical protein HOP50_01g01260 [Chloropicon primus]|eukprot:QDZ17619.1 hypothetical protein A3770_01p01370 [Chloropicon primus]